MRAAKVSVIGVLVAAIAGAAIALIDTRPGWDDTGVTVGALFLGAGLAAFLGARWWAAVLLVAGPLVAAEMRGVGWGLMIAPVVAAVGSLAGTALRTGVRTAFKGRGE